MSRRNEKSTGRGGTQALPMEARGVRAVFASLNRQACLNLNSLSMPLGRGSSQAVEITKNHLRMGSMSVVVV
ncbi:hypothetical protein D3C84_341290 [compost metagenome]